MYYEDKTTIYIHLKHTHTCKCIMEIKQALHA